MRSNCPNPSKVPFETRGEAKAYLRGLKKNPRSHMSGSGMHVYQCKRGAFHLGHHMHFARKAGGSVPEFDLGGHLAPPRPDEPPGLNSIPR